jgi:hypothetical protein
LTRGTKSNLIKEHRSQSNVSSAFCIAVLCGESQHGP